MSIKILLAPRPSDNVIVLHVLEASSTVEITALHNGRPHLVRLSEGDSMEIGFIPTADDDPNEGRLG